MSTINIIRHEGEGYHEWLINEIYMGENVPGRTYHLPNLNDKVIDYERGEYRVIGFDPSGLIPVLELWLNPSIINRNDDTDLNAGLSRRYARNSNRAMVDYSTSRPTVTLDTRAYIYSAQATKAKLFRGTDVSSTTGVVISRVYDSNDNFIGDTVDLVSINPTLPDIKVPERINVDVSLQPGEVVTLVGYSPTGGVEYEEGFVVRLTTAIRNNDLANRYLTDIELVSDLLDPNNPGVIINGLNVPLNTSLLNCRLHYNDGSSTLIGIDGIKCALLGLSGYNNGILGNSTTVSLVYYPDNTEEAINLTNGIRPALFKNYSIVNRRNSNDFAFKLFAVPSYSNINTGYSLRYYLTDAAYALDVDVTDLVVTTKVNGEQWVPTAYGTTQELMATLRVRDALPALNTDYIHIQTFSITLDVPTVGSGSSWIIDYANDGSGTLGLNARARASNVNAVVSIHNDELTLSRWLERFYREAMPAYDPDLLSAAPEPTHFYISYSGETSFHEIEDWNDQLPRISANPFVAFSTLTIIWVYQPTPGDNKILGYTPLVIDLVG